jgi:hypothetical protein
MGQTIGNQIFGPWYDIIGWIAGSAIFFYFAVTVESMPLKQKERLPAFLLSSKSCSQVFAEDQRTSQHIENRG